MGFPVTAGEGIRISSSAAGTNEAEKEAFGKREGIRREERPGRGRYRGVRREIGEHPA